MSYTVTIDWLSFTVHSEKGASNVLQAINPSGIMDPAKPRFGYARAARTQEGIDFLSSGTGNSAGCHFIISGSALRTLAERGWTGLRIIETAVANGAKITRLDLAKDAKDEKFELIQLSQHAQAGMFTGTAQKASTVASSDGGCTVYIGSRQSERFIRIYDKGVESGEGGDWVRLELETKGDAAQLIANALVEGAVRPNDVLSSVVSRMAQFDLPGWKAMLAENAEWSMPKIERVSDREVWIEQQVANAVLSHLDQHPESAAVRRLYVLLKEKLEKAD